MFARDIKKSIVLFLFITFTFLKASGQSAYFQTLNDENGLPSNEVYRIVQDKKGYIWIGCDAGLYRYNGYSFKSYKHAKQNARSISYLQFDNEDNLWCANFSGQIFVVKNDTLMLVADYSSLAGKYHFCFFDKPGYWKIDKNNIEQIGITGKTIKKYPVNLSNDIMGNGTDALYHENTMWVEIPQAGLFYLDENKKELKLLLVTEKNKSYLNQRLFVFNNKLYLVRTESSSTIPNDLLYEINTQSKSVKLISKNENKLYARYYYFYEDKLNKLWVGSSAGAVCINNLSNFNSAANSFFSKNKISSVLNDSEGNYWFTDLQNGIHIIPEMKSIKYNKHKNEEINFDITSLKTLNDSIVIIGHYDGLVSKFNVRNNEFATLDAVNNIKGITVKDIEINNHDIYISRGSLVKYNLKNNTVICPEVYGNARDMIIINDSLYSVHPEYVSRVPLKNILNDKPLVFDKFIQVGGRSVVYEKPTQTIYFALNNGLYTYKNGMLDSILYDGKNIYVYSFAFNSQSIWAATQTRGILEIKNGKIIRSYLNNNELTDVTAKAIYADDKYVWACTNSDLLRFDIQEGVWKTYSLNIGINPRDVTSITKCGHEIFIGTKKSLIRIPVELDPENKTKPQLFIEGISVNDTVLILDTNFVMDYNFSNLKFDFISFSYKSGKKIYYEYRLIGFDSIWIKTNYDNPFALYSSLPAGNYVFQVRSVNESNIKSDFQTISFIVKKPIWQKEWFYALCALIIIFIVISGFRYQIKKIRKRNEIEKKLIVSQLSALKAQMNPHFMYNALNSIQALILKQDIKNSNLYLSKFSNLMRKVLDASDKEFITLKEEFDILTLYLDLEQLRFGNEFKYTIYIDEKIDEYSFRIPAMILQPFIENALKHGLLHKKGEKKLDVYFNLNNNCLSCVIIDNGIGRKKSEEIKQRVSNKHNSFATEATDKRLELFNKYTTGNYKINIIDLYDNNESAGTKVVIEIPLT